MRWKSEEKEREAGRIELAKDWRDETEESPMEEEEERHEEECKGKG